MIDQAAATSDLLADHFLLGLETYCRRLSEIYMKKSRSPHIWCGHGSKGAMGVVNINVRVMLVFCLAKCCYSEGQFLWLLSVTHHWFFQSFFMCSNFFCGRNHVLILILALLRCFAVCWLTISLRWEILFVSALSVCDIDAFSCNFWIIYYWSEFTCCTQWLMDQSSCQKHVSKWCKDMESIGGEDTRLLWPDTCT